MRVRRLRVPSFPRAAAAADAWRCAAAARSIALYDVRAETPLRKLVMLRRANKARTQALLAACLLAPLLR